MKHRRVRPVAVIRVSGGMATLADGTDTTVVSCRGLGPVRVGDYLLQQDGLVLDRLDPGEAAAYLRTEADLDARRAESVR